MKEAQPTRTDIWVYGLEAENQALRAELEQVRRDLEEERAAGRLRKGLEEYARKKLEAAESRERTAREALEELIETVEDSDIAHPCIDAVLARARRALEGE